MNLNSARIFKKMSKTAMLEKEIERLNTENKRLLQIVESQQRVIEALLNVKLQSTLTNSSSAAPTDFCLAINDYFDKEKKKVIWQQHHQKKI